MLRLSDAIPRDAIRAKIGDFEEKVTANTAAEYIERDPTGTMTTGLYGWDYAVAQQLVDDDQEIRSEEHTSELQSLMRISYAVFCLKKKKNNKKYHNSTTELTHTRMNTKRPSSQHSTPKHT